MSNKASNWAWSQRVKNIHAKLVLLCLADKAGFSNECWPYIDTIAQETELSRSSVIRAIKFLTERKLIAKSPRRSKRGRQASSMYLCNIPECPPDILETSRVSTFETLEKPSRVSGVTPQGVHCDTHTDEPTLNPQRIERKKNEEAVGKGGKKGKPRHGQRTKDGKRVWLDYGTSDWNVYAQEYARAHAGMGPEKQWQGRGSWFNYSGE